MGKKKKMNNTTILGATFIGVLIGVSIGMLFARDKGKMNCKKLMIADKQPLDFEIAGISESGDAYSDDHRPPLK